MKKLLIPLAVITVIILVISGCGGASTTTTSQPTSTQTSVTTVKPMETTSTPTTTAASQIKRGGTLQYIYPYSPIAVPGWPADNANFQRLWMNWTVFEPLVKPDRTYQPTPWLATSWDWAPDKSYIVFHLRQNVMYHDGSIFKAANVKFEGDLMIEQGGTTGANWDSWEIIDDYTIRLNLKKYQNNFWGGFFGISMCFPSVEAINTHGEDWVKEHPIGTGPYTFENFEMDVKMELKAYDNYWQEGKPYLDGLDFVTVKETLTAQSVMEAGEGDIWALQQGKTLYDMKNMGFDVRYDYGGTDFLLFDTQNPDSVTSNVKVRMAIEYAIDKQAMADALGYGFLIPNNQWSPPYNPSFNPDLPSRDYDPAMAKQLLTEAGYPNGTKLHIVTIGSEPEILSVQQYLEAVGFEVELESVDNAKFWNYCATGWTGLLNVGYAIGSDNFPAALKAYFGPTATINVSVKIPDEILAKVEMALSEQDPVKAKALSNEIIKDLYDDCWMVPFYSNAMGFILRTDVMDSGVEDFADWSLWSPENVWLDR